MCASIRTSKGGQVRRSWTGHIRPPPFPLDRYCAKGGVALVHDVGQLCIFLHGVKHQIGARAPHLYGFTSKKMHPRETKLPKIVGTPARYTIYCGQHVHRYALA